MEVIDEVAGVLKMDCDVITRASLRAFLEKKLRYIEAEIFEVGATRTHEGRANLKGGYLTGSIFDPS